jgi:copper chaperone CopZ
MAERKGSVKAQVAISGTHCAACAAAIEKELAKISGVSVPVVLVYL